MLPASLSSNIQMPLGVLLSLLRIGYLLRRLNLKWHCDNRCLLLEAVIGDPSHMGHYNWPRQAQSHTNA